MKGGAQGFSALPDICLGDFLYLPVWRYKLFLQGLKLRNLKETTLGKPHCGWLEAGSWTGSGPGPGVCPWGAARRDLNQQCAFCLLRGFLPGVAEEAAL